MYICISRCVHMYRPLRTHISDAPIRSNRTSSTCARLLNCIFNISSQCRFQISYGVYATSGVIITTSRHARMTEHQLPFSSCRAAGAGMNESENAHATNTGTGTGTATRTGAPITTTTTTTDMRCCCYQESHNC